MPPNGERFQTFLDRTEKLLTDTLLHGSQLFSPEINELFRRAWTEIRPLFALVREQMNALGAEEKLQAAGLTGAQLNLKLTGLTRAMTAFRASDWEGRLLKKLLGWINTILGSVLAFPGVEAIKEMKEAFEREAWD